MSRLYCYLSICLLVIISSQVKAQPSTMVATTYRDSGEGLEVGETVNTAPYKASKEYKLCIVFPNMKDSYWKLIIGGIEEQVEQAGVSYNIFQASGYESISQQVSIVENRCLRMNFDAILIAAISKSGFMAL